MKGRLTCKLVGWLLSSVPLQPEPSYFILVHGGRWGLGGGSAGLSEMRAGEINNGCLSGFDCVEGVGGVVGGW